MGRRCSMAGCSVGRVLWTRRPLTDSDCEQRRVIPEASGRERRYAGDDRVDRAPCRFAAMCYDGFDQTIVVELCSVRSFGFGDAIGEEHDAIAGLEPDGVLRVTRLRRDAHEETAGCQTN